MIGGVTTHAQGVSKIFPHSASNRLTVTTPRGDNLSHVAQPGTICPDNVLFSLPY